jgi:DNA-binding transcriptional MerR regulator
VADLTIGELAATAGVGIETIRYYERKNVLPEPCRARSGYRQYGDDDVWRLAFILRAKALGFTLREIAELLGAGHDQSVDEVQRLTRTRLCAVEREIEVLTQRRDDLRRLLATCAEGAADDCLHLTATTTGARDTSSTNPRSDRAARAASSRHP